MRTANIYERAKRRANYEYNCTGISKRRWDTLMKGARHADRKKVLKVALAAGVIDEFQYKEERNNEYYNPYDHFITRTHVIYVHSAIEHFIRVA